MNSKIHYSWLLLLVPLIFSVWFFLDAKDNRPVRRLPYFGPKHKSTTSDTVYHKVGNFSFTNQFGELTDFSTIKGKILVVEYFFTTCKSICPIMNSNLIKVYREFDSREDFLILSHTVDPEQDSVQALKSYAGRYGVHDKQWLFLTGDKRKLYGQARQSYLLNSDSGKGDANDFIHTQNFALVDKDLHIRGYYDGTDSIEINRLIAEIKLLYQEYEYNRKTSD